MTAAYINSAGLFKSEPAQLPAAFLLELGAVLDLGLWEQLDLRRHISVDDLPTHREAADWLAARCVKGPSEFKGSEAALLSPRVLQAWLEHFAWSGPELLQADIVVGEVDEEEFVDLLAEFIWEYRHALAGLCQNRGLSISESTNSMGRMVSPSGWIERFRPRKHDQSARRHRRLQRTKAHILGSNVSVS